MLAATSPKAGALQLLALFVGRAWTAHGLIHHADGSNQQQLAPALNGSVLRRSSEIAGWTKIISCVDQDSTDRMLFSAAEIQSMAMDATRIKYCHYPSTTDCVTSVANTPPIVMLRQGGSTSHKTSGSPCYTGCVNAYWEDDDLSAGLALPGAMWASCSTGAATTGALTGAVLVHQTCNNVNGLVLSVNAGGACCWKSGGCYQGTDPEAGVDMYIDIAALSAPPTSSPTTAAPTSSPTTAAPTSSPTTAMPTSSPTAASTTSAPEAATSFGDPHVSNLRGERFDILSPGDFVYLSIPRAAAGTAEGGQGGQRAGGGLAEAGGGNATLLRIVAKVEPLGRLCQEGLLFVTGLELSGQWVLGGRVQSLGLSTNVEAKMEAQALKIKLLQEEREDGSIAARDLSPSELAAEFGPSAGLIEVTDYEPKKLPGAINQHVTVLLLKLRLGPTIAKVRMVQQRERDDKAEEAEAEEEKKEAQTATMVKKIGEQTVKGRPRFSNSLWLTVTGLEGVREGGGAGIGGILGFDDHRAASQTPEECLTTANFGKQRSERLTGHGGVHAMATLGQTRI